MSLDTAVGALEATSGLPIQTTGPSGCRVATLPPNHCCTALLVHDADKLTYGQRLLVYTPHAIEGILKQPPSKLISNTRLTHYQALLLDTPRIHFQTTCFLNPAILLPNLEEDSPLHDCGEILAETMAIRKDLTNVPLNNSELIWSTDKSSFIKDGQRKAGAS